MDPGYFGTDDQGDEVVIVAANRDPRRAHEYRCEGNARGYVCLTLVCRLT
jgi:hypothetical protein